MSVLHKEIWDLTRGHFIDITLGLGPQPGKLCLRERSTKKDIPLIATVLPAKLKHCLSYEGRRMKLIVKLSKSQYLLCLLFYAVAVVDSALARLVPFLATFDMLPTLRHVSLYPRKRKQA